LAEEELLEGGNLSAVVRVGDTVRRPLKPWSTAVHALLRHLAAKQFTGAPRFLGLDDQGREILSFIPGVNGEQCHLWADEVLISAARLLRHYHDATVDFLPAPETNWQYIHPDAHQHEVICHNDFAPYNLIFDPHQPIGLIDFDMAGPGPRLRDVAMAVYWFTPLSLSSHLTARSQQEVAAGCPRLHLFCQTYGVAVNEELLDWVARWLAFMGTFPVTQVAAGHGEYQRLIDEGHVAHWQREYAAFAAYRPQIEAVLF
jgi:aminoglycoside phosphotransferase